QSEYTSALARILSGLRLRCRNGESNSARRQRSNAADDHGRRWPLGRGGRSAGRGVRDLPSRAARLMEIIDLARIRSVLNYAAIIERMRDALIANSRGECDTPMPMHLDIAPEQAEVHMKSSYRQGGRYFALKIACTF